MEPAVDVGAAILVEEVVDVAQADLVAGAMQEQALDSFEALAEHWDTKVGSTVVAVEFCEERV